MELKALSGLAATKDEARHKGSPDDRCGWPKKKKKRSAMHLFRVALYMLKSGKSKPVQVDASAASKWKKLLGSMRPLHVQSNQSPPQLIEDLPERPAGPPPLAVTELAAEQLESLSPPMSPAPTSICSPSTNQYASALNLQDLDEPSDDEEDEQFYDGEGDSMIDIKAEQFIAQFYQQMRNQEEAYTTRRKDRVQE